MTREWTEAEDRKLIAALKADRTRKWIVALAKQLGRTHQSLQHRLHELKEEGRADLTRKKP